MRLKDVLPGDPKSKVVRWLLNHFGPDDVRLDSFEIESARVGSDIRAVVHVQRQDGEQLELRVQVFACRVGRRDGSKVVAWDGIEIGPVDLPLNAGDVVLDGLRAGPGHVRPERGVPRYVGPVIGTED